MRDRSHERKATAIILRRSDVFDADRSYLLFTREEGVLRARARGVRKPGSKLAGHLTLYHIARVELAETGDWYLITQAQQIGPSGAVDVSLAYLDVSSVLAELLAQLLQEREAHPVIFDGLAYTLERIALACEQGVESWKVRLLAAEFVLKSLVVLGFKPELDVCATTGEVLTKERLGWSSELGGVLSEAGMRQTAGGYISIKDARSLIGLRQLAKPEFFTERLVVPEEVAYEILSLIANYAQTTTGKPLKSLLGT